MVTTTFFRGLVLPANRIETMNSQEPPPLHSTLEQVYLTERDTGLLCRILGLYAARGIDVARADYAYAAQHVMTLKVAAAADGPDAAEALRVLVDKASTLVGVIAAAIPPPPRHRAAASHERPGSHVDA
ncbi:MAG: hypothetical protein KIT60_09815 [Burkholderiaceae bacterium]|nr:hypothetical protein [Burkholderiaceae bacterium]